MGGGPWDRAGPPPVSPEAQKLLRESLALHREMGAELFVDRAQAQIA